MKHITCDIAMQHCTDSNNQTIKALYTVVQNNKLYVSSNAICAHKITDIN